MLRCTSTVSCKSCHIQEVCYQYWPGSGSAVYGEYTVELLNEEKLEGFVLRTLSVHTKVSHYIAISHIDDITIGTSLWQRDMTFSISTCPQV